MLMKIRFAGWQGTPDMWSCGKFTSQFQTMLVSHEYARFETN
jgi:hypothetical protein